MYRQNGKIVIEPRTLNSAKDFHNGLAYIVTKNGEHGYIDKAGSYAWKPTLQSMNCIYAVARSLSRTSPPPRVGGLVLAQSQTRGPEWGCGSFEVHPWTETQS